MEEDDNKYNIQDLVTSTLEQKPDEFGQAFNNLMVDRLRSAVEARKQEISQEMFAGPQPEYADDEYEDETTEVDQETELDPEE